MQIRIYMGYDDKMHVHLTQQLDDNREGARLLNRAIEAAKVLFRDFSDFREITVSTDTTTQEEREAYDRVMNERREGHDQGQS